jgi:hypothetical protein
LSTYPAAQISGATSIDEIERGEYITGDELLERLRRFG